MTKRILLISIAILTVIGLFAQLPVNSKGRSPFVDVVKNIRASVVNIKVEFTPKIGSNQLPLNQDFFKFFFPEPFKIQPKARKSIDMGSGFIFKRKGQDVYIITNNHVVEGGEDGEITVTLADKAKYKAEIVGLDPDSDLAVIKIKVDKDEDVTIAPLGDSDNIQIGEWAIAIGNPFGQLGLERTVTVGVISAVGRSNLHFGGSKSPVFQNYIQTDAAINPGNSGGPLVNIEGKVIGVNSAITSTTGGNIGIGFAIPINLAKKVVNDLITSGKVKRAYLGIYLQEINSDLRKTFNLDDIAGVLVTRVVKDTPADKGGLKNGDVIIEFNGKKVENVPKFMIMVAGSEIGVKIPIKIVRNNKRKTIFVKLVERTDDVLAKGNETKSANTDWLGLKVESLSSDFAKKYNIDEKEGVIISKIEDDTPASNSDLMVGDIILAINQEDISGIEDYTKIMKEYKDKKNGILLFYVKSKNNVYRYVPVDLKTE
jgi:serine protease Do